MLEIQQQSAISVCRFNDEAPASGTQAGVAKALIEEVNLRSTQPELAGQAG